MKNRKLIFQIVGAILALLIAVALLKDRVHIVGGVPVFKKKQKAAPEKPVEAPATPVKVYRAARVNFRDALPALGSTKGFREFELKFPTNGTIEYLNFREGEKITQGDIIASLDQREALLKLEYAKIEFEKNQKLFELGSIIEPKLKQSQLEYQSAKAELDKTNLVAVSDGTVGSIDVDRGSVVSPQDKIGTFVDFKDIYAEFGVIEKDISKLKESQHIELTLDAFPDQVFKGQIDSLSPIVEGRSRTLRVRAKIPNPDEKIRPGMFGRVNVLVYEKENALVIPSASFKKKEDAYFVNVVHLDEPASSDEDGEVSEAGQAPASGSTGVVETRQIEVEYATPDAIEVKEGLDEGEFVVVESQQELQDKARVEITETQEGIF